MKDESVSKDTGMMLSKDAIGRLMPMHIALDLKGNVISCGPTLSLVLKECGLSGQKFFELFNVKRPMGIASMRKLPALLGEKVQLRLNAAGHDFTLRGLCHDFAGGHGYLLNLSFGIGVVDAVRHFQLTEADFAHTDLAIEMLYLVEAKSAVMQELKELNLRLQSAKQVAEQQALTDTLSGLTNRRGMELELSRLINLRKSFTLMHMDLDFFKQVNDTLGHAAGDHVLRTVAQILLLEIRDSDIVARVGGDEFVLVLQRLDEGNLDNLVADRIIAAVSAPIDFEGQPCRVSCSIGITKSAFYEVLDSETLHADADMALYEAKRAGRGRALLFAPQVDVARSA